MPEIHQSHLQHSSDRHPTIGLAQVIVERLDRSGITERGRNLAGFGGKTGGKTLAEAADFHEIAPVVGPQGNRRRANAVNQFRRIGPRDKTAQTLFTRRPDKLQAVRMRNDISFRGQQTISVPISVLSIEARENRIE